MLCKTKRENLINATGRISGQEAHELFLQLTQVLPDLRSHIIKVLHRHHFRADKQMQPVIEALIRNYLVNAAAILHMQKNIYPFSQQYKILFGSLQLELSSIRETLLFLFSFLYDREKISKIKAAIEINKKETNANAIELVDMTFKKEFANPFNAAFEHGDLEHRCALLKNIFPKDIYHEIDSILEEVLMDKKLFYNNWTKASSLYTTKRYGPRLASNLFRNTLDQKTFYYMKRQSLLLVIHNFKQCMS